MRILLITLIALAFLSCKNKNTSSGQEISNNIIKADNLPIDGMVLNHWQILGPFSANGEDDYLNEDNLKYFGFNESTIEYKDFVMISRKDAKQGTQLLDNFDNKHIASQDYLVDLNKVFGYLQMEQSISGNAYLACIIKSDKEKTVRLDFTSDDGAKIWLNHKQILYIEKAESVMDYENYLQLDLLKGENFLLVKVNNGMYDWQMYARLQNESENGLRRHRNLVKRVNNHNFFTSSIIDSGNSLVLGDKLPANRYFVRIADEDGKAIYEDTINTEEKRNIDLPTLGHGLFYGQLFLNNDSMQQVIFKGKIVNDTKNIILELNNHRLSRKMRNRVDAIIYRFNHLLKPGNRGSSLTENQLWQRKIINLHIDLRSILANVGSLLERKIAMPGTHIGTYVSEIDNQVQYYLVHVPKKHMKGKYYPLMIFMPAKLPNHQEYLESMRLADQKLIENLQDLVDKYDIIVLEPFCREVGKINFNSIEETDLFEALKSIKEDYDIDTTRIFLSGSCAGAYKALRFAVRYPTMFAAVGVVAPIFTSKLSMTTNEWISQSEPLLFIRNIQNIPILIIHSALDNHSSVENSDRFIDSAKINGLTNIIYRRLNNVIDTYYWYEFSDEVVAFLMNYRLISNPKSVFYSTRQLKYNKAYWINILQIEPTKTAAIEAYINSENTINVVSKNVISYALDINCLSDKNAKPVVVIDNGKIAFKGQPIGPSIIIDKNTGTKSFGLIKNQAIEGPFAHALIHKFIIVIGHSGTHIENKSLKRMADSIRAFWKYKYFNDCSAKYDYEITPNDVQEANLILLGNYNSNKILKSVQDKLPLIITKTSIAISKRIIYGNSLGFYFVYPNPLNKNKYLALIGYNNPRNISFGELDMNDSEYKNLITYLQNIYYTDISCYGWYDYRIWDNTNDSGNPLICGYFDNNWN